MENDTTVVSVDGKTGDDANFISLENYKEGEYAPTSVVLQAHKILEGKNLEEGLFTFELKNEDGETIQTKKNDLEGNVVFDEIEYNQPGEYHYTIQEVSGDEAGIIYDKNIIRVAVHVEDKEGYGRLTATPEYVGGSQTFTNTYQAAPGSVLLEAQKVLEGKELKAGDFSFNLKDESGNVLQTKTNDAQGKVYFDSIEYTEAGLYQYTIEEVKGNLAGVTYDSHVIDVTVTVEDKDEYNETGIHKYTIEEVKGNLAGVTYDSHVIDVTVTVEDKDAQLVAEPVYEGSQTFTNTYQAAPGSIVLETQKILEGKDLKAGDFSFDLKDESGNILQTKANDAQGKVYFDPIEYNETGIHKYTIEEVKGNLAGVTYDSHVINVTVTVEDKEAQLVAEPVYEGAQTFTNSYKPAAGSVVLEAQKVLKGKELKAGDFKFELKDEEGNVLQTQSNDAQGKVYFDPVDYTKAGIYKYTIEEVKGNLAGVTYDSHVINVKVTVEE